MKKTFEEIRAIYVKRYPHLINLKSKKYFAKQALLLAAPEGISPQDITALTKEIDNQTNKNDMIEGD